MLLRLFHRSFHSGEVDGFKNISVQSTSFLAVEWHTQHDECIGQTLHTKSDRTVTHVRLASFFNRIIVDIDYLIQVSRSNFSYLIQFIVIELAIFRYEFW